MQAIESMRLHPVYSAFERRWQLPVYFQLRWKEIVTKLEEQLAVTKLERSPSKGIFRDDATLLFPSLTAPRSERALCYSTRCCRMGSYIQLLECANIHTGPELQILETDLTSDCHPCLRYCYNSLQVSLADQSTQNMARRMQPTS
jgi:hypothetical protein